VADLLNIHKISVGKRVGGGIAVDKVQPWGLAKGAIVLHVHCVHTRKHKARKQQGTATRSDRQLQGPHVCACAEQPGRAV
jgi:hypothetical protein